MATGTSAAKVSKLGTDEELSAAFSADRFDAEPPEQWQRFRTRRGIVARSRESTLYTTGEPKVAYYVEGTGYEMGHLLGQLAEPEVSKMTESWLSHIVPSFLSTKWDKTLAEGVVSKALYNHVLSLLASYLARHASASFARDRALFPDALVEEMEGTAAGCQAANPNTPVTLDKLVAINYAFDYGMAHLLAGKMPAMVREENERRAADSESESQPAGPAASSPCEASRERRSWWERMRGAISDLDMSWFRPPAACNAAVFGPRATAGGGKEVFFCRDFQLQNGLVYQDVACMVVRLPTDGRYASVSACAPGMIGSVTAMNLPGCAMGVDLYRSASCNPDHPGLNSLLLTRHVVDTCATVERAVEEIANARRGVPWLYTVGDSSGDGAVVEAGAWCPAGEEGCTLRFVEDEVLKALLPSSAELAALPAPGARCGIFVRRMNQYRHPVEFTRPFNRHLFAHADVAPLAGAEARDGLLFEGKEDEAAASQRLGNAFFPEARCDDLPDVLLVSNASLTPHARITQMGPIATKLQRTATAITWRYDRLNQLARAAHGAIDLAEAKRIACYLAPDHYPTYWAEAPLDKRDPMTTAIEGSISVCELAHPDRRMHTRSGYWKDAFYTCSLARYCGGQTGAAQ